MTPSTQNSLAHRLRTLHVPGNPVILTNVWDAITASAIASLPQTRALATASFAVAAATGLDDDDLDLETNLRAATAIARVAKKHDLPLTVDFQDGYAEKLEEGIRALIRLGAVGINLEDLGREVGGLYDVETQCERIRRVVKVASEEGVPDFVVNARTDSLFAGNGLSDALERGQAYLEAGAFNVFIWGGPDRRGWGSQEIKQAVEKLDGRLNVSFIHGREGGLTLDEVRRLGVARVSLGPALMRWGSERIKEEAVRILGGEN